jgi:uncharacterized protein with beta-barrel porin domain
MWYVGRRRRGSGWNQPGRSDGPQMTTIRALLPLRDLVPRRVSARAPHTSRTDVARREPPAARFAAALSVLAVLGFASGPALAQCLPASPLVSGDTVTCTGTIGATYPFPVLANGNPVDNITVVIEPGTTISTIGDGIQLNDRSQVDNSGSLFVNGPLSAAIRSGSGVSGNPSPINNTQGGSITVGADQAYGIFTGDFVQIQNDGAIRVDGDDSYAVSVGNGSVGNNSFVANGATGTIDVNGSNSVGLHAVTHGRVLNAGVVTLRGDSSTAIDAGPSGLVLNAGTVQVDATDAVGIVARPFDASLPGQGSPTFFNVQNTTDTARGQTGTIASGVSDAGPLIRLLPPSGGPGNFLNRVRNDPGASILADATLLGTAGRAIAIQGSSGRDEISNAGAIQGVIDLADGDDVYSQAATGNVAFLAPGVLDGGPGIDTLRLNAANAQLGIFTADAARNFEMLDVQGYWSVRGSASAPPGGLAMTVAPGAMLQLDAPLFVDGSVMLTAPAIGQTPASVRAVLGASTSGLAQILHSTGTTTIDTGTLDVLVNSLVGTQTFTILRSDTDLVGQFASVNLPFDPGLSFGALIYDDLANTLSLSITAAGYTPNATAVSNYLSVIEATGATPELQAVIDGLNTLPYSSYGAAMDQLHPEAYDAHTTQTLELANRFTDLMLERPRVCVAARGEQKLDPRTQLVCREHRFEPWLAVYGQLGNRTGSTGHISYEDQGTGLVAGLDHRISERLLVTGTIGTSYDSLDVDAVGVGRFTTLDLGLYAGYTRGPLRVQGVASYGHGWQSRFRNISIPGFARTSTGEWGSNRIGTRLEGEYAFDLRGWSLAPMASIDYTALLQDAVYETGALPVSLRVDSRTDNIVTLRAGFEVSSAWHKRGYWTEALETIDGVWRPNLSVQWRQVVAGADRALTADFIGDPGGAAGQFTVYGESPSEGFEVGAGIDWTPRSANRLTFGLRYDVFVWTDVLSQDLTASVRFSF